MAKKELKEQLKSYEGFIQDGKEMGSPTFSSAYFCSDFLPKQIIMEKLDMN